MFSNINNMNDQMMNNNMNNQMMMNNMNNQMMNNNLNNQMMMNNMNNQNMFNNMNNQIMNDNMNNQNMFNNMNNQNMFNNNMQNQMMMNNNMNIPMSQMANNQMNIMNQNLFNNNQFQGNNNPKQQSDNQLTVYFRDSGNDNNKNTDGPSITIQCTPDEKVSKIIERYRTKANFHEEAKFVFNAKNLVPSLTIAEAGITNLSNVFVVKTKHVKGAYSSFYK